MNAIATSVPRSGPGRATRAAMTLAAAALGLAIPVTTHAEWLPPLVVLPASGREVSTQIIQRARWYLVQSLSRPDRFRVIDYDRAPTDLPPAPNTAMAVAQLMGARVAVSLDLSREEGRTVFELRCWDAQTGQPACHVREATAAGPDLLPDFAEWLALKLLTQISGSPGEAMAGTPSGAARPRQPRALTVGLRAGLLVPIDSPASDTAVLGGFGPFLAVDSGTLITDLGLEYASGAEQRRLLGVGLDLFVPLGTGERLPYVGTGVWWVDQRLGGRGAAGVQLRPTLGMLWGRHDVARVRVEVAYFVDLFEERELDRLIPGSGQAHVAHGLMLSTGATF